MSSQSERFVRQQRLREVGMAGQASIERHRAIVHAHAGTPVEIAYLERAGVESLSVERTAPTTVFPHAPAFHFPASRATAEGAWRALEQLRTALGLETS